MRRTSSAGAAVSALCSLPEGVMALRVSSMLVFTIFVGCTGTDKAATETDGTGDDSGAGGSGTTWRAEGSGSAYFADGSEDDSLFHLEVSRAAPPRDGEAYYGFVSRGGADPIALGEIAA